MNDPRDTLLQAVAPYEWVRWLSGTDAALLLMILCQVIEDATCPRETLVKMVEDWRANALKALDDEAWTADVDSSLDVRADARAWLASQGRLS